MTTQPFCTFRVALVAASVTCRLWAEVSRPAIFADNMVLQKGVPIPLRGTAEPAEKVTVEFAGQRLETVAGDAGKWAVTLQPLQPSAEPAELQVTGDPSGPRRPSTATASLPGVRP
jgi:sialate O-acetylesterase